MQPEALPEIGSARRAADSIRRLTRSDAVVMSTVAGTASAIYAVVHWDGPAPLLVLLLALSMPLSAQVWAWAARRFHRPAAVRDAVFVCGSVVAIGTVAGMVYADGGNSPLIAWFFPLTAFIAVSVGTRVTLALFAVTIAAYLITAGADDAASMLVRAASLGGLGAVSMLQARAQRRARHRLRDASLRDALTGLPNRTLLTDRLHHAAQRSGRHAERHLAVAFIDLDNFKAVNDTLGHRAGDELLRVLAPRLARAIRGADTLARFGGDEFVVLMEDLDDNEEAIVIADRLLCALQRPATIGGRTEHVRASIGLVMGDNRYWDDPEALLRDADTAMYRAKTMGGGRIEIFDEDTRDRVMTRVGTERDLRDALGDARQLHLVYQPIVDLRTGGACRAEALLRWRHPSGELIPPSFFIPIAEQSRLIVPIGEWVLREACAQTAEWRATEGLAGAEVSVNVSAAQISPLHDLPALLADALADAGLARGALTLEITETMLIESPIETAATLEEVSASGLGIALDDFGTGFSSLSSLRSFPLDAIKLDRSYIAQLQDQRTQAIVHSVIDLAHGLGLVAVAEGVETIDQLELLLALGCDYAQGYLFSKPVAPAELPAIMRAGFEDLLARAATA